MYAQVQQEKEKEEEVLMVVLMTRSRVRCCFCSLGVDLIREAITCNSRIAVPRTVHDTYYLGG